MLNDADASGFKKVYLAMGFTDLRRGIDGLATIVRFQFKLDPYDKNTLFLFCGRRCDRIKALLWEADGLFLRYNRLDNGAFRWPGVQYQMVCQKSQYLCGFASFSGWKIKKQKSQNTSFQKIFHRRYDPRWSGAEVPSSRLAPLDFSEYH